MKKKKDTLIGKFNNFFEYTSADQSTSQMGWLYMCILYLLNKNFWNPMAISDRQLASFCDINRNTLGKLRQRLQDAGLVKFSVLTSRGIQSTVQYEIPENFASVTPQKHTNSNDKELHQIVPLMASNQAINGIKLSHSKNTQKKQSSQIVPLMASNQAINGNESSHYSTFTPFYIDYKTNKTYKTTTTTNACENFVVVVEKKDFQKTTENIPSPTPVSDPLDNPSQAEPSEPKSPAVSVAVENTPNPKTALPDQDTPSSQTPLSAEKSFNFEIVTEVEEIRTPSLKTENSDFSQEIERSSAAAAIVVSAPYGATIHSESARLEQQAGKFAESQQVAKLRAKLIFDKFFDDAQSESRRLICKNNFISETELRQVCEEIMGDWQLCGELHDDGREFSVSNGMRHLTNTIRIKAKALKKAKRFESGGPKDSRTVMATHMENLASKLPDILNGNNSHTELEASFF